jgi:hypothetical protein
MNYLKLLLYILENKLLNVCIMEQPSPSYISNSILSGSTPSSSSSYGLGNSISSSTSTATSTSTSGNSFLNYIYSISLTTWLLIILILAFLGFNVFIYLAKGTQEITSIFSPIINKIASILGGVTGQIVDVSAEGAKGAVNVSANVINSGLTAVQNITPGHNEQQGTPVQHTVEEENQIQNSSLGNALNTSVSENQIYSSNEFQADDSLSSIQRGSAGKAGWCFIGEDRGFRTCESVGPNDQCMSGEIFPSNEICINPNLRT